MSELKPQFVTIDEIWGTMVWKPEFDWDAYGAGMLKGTLWQGPEGNRVGTFHARISLPDVSEYSQGQYYGRLSYFDMSEEGEFTVIFEERADNPWEVAMAIDDFLRNNTAPMLLDLALNRKAILEEMAYDAEADGKDPHDFRDTIPNFYNWV